MDSLTAVHLGDITQKKNVGVQSHATVKKLFHLMRKNDKGVVVILKDRIPIGIMTERDAVRLIYSGIDLEEQSERYAKKNLIVTSADRTITYALNMMIENNIRRLVVVDQSGEFLGIVTQKDLLKHLEGDFYRSSLKVKHILDQLKELVSARRKDTLISVIEKMVRNNISAVPILDRGVAVGIITEKDILSLADENISFKQKVEDYMSRPVICVEFDTKLDEIVHLLNQKNIKRVVVNYADGHAAGVITNRDLVRNLEGDYNEFLEKKLRYSKEVLNLMPEMLFELVDTGREQLIIWTNEKVLNIFGGEIMDKPVTDLVPLKRWKYIYSRLLEQNRVENVGFKKGDKYYEFSGFYLPMEKSSEKGRIQLILRDTTEDLIHSATDALTNIFNRKQMNDFLAKETERSKRNGRPYTIVMADIDDFKFINDNYGYTSGDIVLRRIAETIMNGIREYDLLGRYGGEEFLIIMPEIEKKKAQGVIERIRKNIEECYIELMEGNEISVTASFGIATFNEDGESPDKLLLKTIKRLCTAKQRGKNRIIASSG